MLKRSIRKGELVLLVINGVIGAGIFGLPAIAFREAGIWSLAAFLVCAIAVFVIVLSFAEVSSQFEKTGGPYLYAMHAFGQLPAFLTGWLLLLTRFITYAALINLFVTYLSVFSPWFSQPLSRSVTIISFTAIMAFINHLGVRNSTTFNNVMTIAKLSALFIFIIIGFFYIDFSRFENIPPPGFGSFSSTVLLLVFSFGGFESVLVNTGEIQEPRKNLPFALLTATLIIAVIYLLIQLVCIGTFPGLATSGKPLADAAGLFMGKAGAVFIATGALFSITGTLNAIMLTGSRLPYAFSEEKHFPSIFSYVHPRYLTPTWSLLLFASITTVVSLFHSFIDAATLSAITRVMIYGIVCIALLRLRKMNNDKVKTFRIPYGKVIAVTGLLITLWLLTGSPMYKLRDVAVAMIAGIAIYYSMIFFRKRK